MPQICVFSLFCISFFLLQGFGSNFAELVFRAKEQMETAKATAPPKFGSVARTVTKILRFSRNAAGSGSVAGDVLEEDEATVHKLKLSHNLGDYYAVLSGPPLSEFCKVEHEKSLASKLSTSKEAAASSESLLENLFASISKIKVSYAQLQIAEDPYDPDSIQKCDLAIVAELKKISEIKQSYVKKQFLPCSTVAIKQPSLLAQIEERRKLIKTYQTKNDKLETDLKHKDARLQSLQTELLEYEKKNQSLEAKIFPCRSLSTLEDLHLSCLNPTHFFAALRYTYKAIRSFVKIMVNGMESVGWNLDEAAGAIQPVFLCRKNLAHRNFAFESYVCQKMFSDFHHKSFNLPSLEQQSTWGPRHFFKEFSKLKSAASSPAKWSQSRSWKLSSTAEALASFYRAKYSLLVHPKLESAFFGDLEHSGFPKTAFFAEFVEMARRVWLLHCLFFSFETVAEAPSIFQVRGGSRFSEVYMESVAEDSDGSDRFRPDKVGFTVVPGFRVGRMLTQCKVYLSSTVQ